MILKNGDKTIYECDLCKTKNEVKIKVYRSYSKEEVVICDKCFDKMMEKTNAQETQKEKET
jgi:predicted SprT family Zn-dependent metalloprotease